MKVSYPYYFVTWQQAGHHLFVRNASGMSSYCQVPAGFDLAELDQGFLPYKIRPHDNFDALTHLPQGTARLTHTRGNTVLAFNDWSVDSRQGSHSTFVLPGTLTFEKAVECAKFAFPEVWARFKFPIKRWEDTVF